MANSDHADFMQLATRLRDQLRAAPDSVPQALGELRGIARPLVSSVEDVEAWRHLLYGGVAPVLSKVMGSVLPVLSDQRFVDALRDQMFWMVKADMLRANALAAEGWSWTPGRWVGPGEQERAREAALQQHGIVIPTDVHGALIGPDRFNVLQVELLERGIDAIRVGLEDLPAGYRALSDVLDELCGVRSAVDRRDPSNLEDLLCAGFQTGVISAVQAAEALPSYLAGATDASLPPGAGAEQRLRSSYLRSPVLRSMARADLDQLELLREVLARCNGGCGPRTRALEEGRSTVGEPAHSPRSELWGAWHPLPVADDVDAFVGTHTSLVPWDASALRAVDLADGIGIDLSDEVKARLGLGEGAIGCPALFGGIVRQLSEVIADHAAEPSLWGHQLELLSVGAWTSAAAASMPPTARGARRPRGPRRVAAPMSVGNGGGVPSSAGGAGAPGGGAAATDRESMLGRERPSNRSARWRQARGGAGGPESL